MHTRQVAEAMEVAARDVRATFGSGSQYTGTSR